MGFLSVAEGGSREVCFNIFWSYKKVFSKMNRLTPEIVMQNITCKIY